MTLEVEIQAVHEALARMRQRTSAALHQLHPSQRQMGYVIVNAIREVPLELRLLTLEERARDLPDEAPKEA